MQILLPLESRREASFEGFLPGPNGATVTAVRELLETAGSCAFLSGPEGSGKTHLLNALCNLARERGLSAFYIAPASLPEDAAEGLAGIESCELLCVDDIDGIAGRPAWEEALFHCFNRMRAHSRHLVLASTRPLASIRFTLPDLGSRLAWGLRLRLAPLEDTDKGRVLERRAAALGVQLPEEVRDYLLKHGARNLASLLASLEAIRSAALAGKRRITVPLAREVLAAARAGSPGL